MHLPALSKNATILWLLSYTVTTCNGYGVTWRSGLAMTRAHGLGLVGGDTRVSVSKRAEELAQTAEKLASSGKGILAADESTNTMGKRFKLIGVENLIEMRQAYRELLLTCPGLGEYISGVILCEETLFQNCADGTPFVDCIKNMDIIPGIKVDAGLLPLPGGYPTETWSAGLDGLAVRAHEAYEKGARFAKWRAVTRITEDGAPSELAIQENAWGLARYAWAVQEAGLVPIVEPEILMDGSHSIETAAHVQEKVLAAVYKALADNGVYLEGSLLKPSMVSSGIDCTERATIIEIGKFTIQTMERYVPSAVPGIMFLSGGMSEEEASINLSTINTLPRKAAWSLSFSYGRALQRSCIEAWQGKANNVRAAQTALIARAKANSEATLGKYIAGSQPSAAAAPYVKGYKY